MIFLEILFLFCEIPMLVYLIAKINRDKQFSLKDTAIYPFLLVEAIFIIFFGKLKYAVYEHWYNLIPEALSSSIKLLTLTMDTSFVELLKAQDKFLLVNYYAIYGISALALFSISFLLFKAIINNIFRIKFFNKEINYIVNLSNDAKLFIQTLSKEERKNIVVILNQKNNVSYTDEKLFLDQYKIKFYVMPIISLKYKLKKYFNSSMKRLTKFLDKKTYRFISFLENDEEVYNFINLSKEYLSNNNLYESNLKFIIVTDSEKVFYINELIKGSKSDILEQDRNGNKAMLLDESRGAIRVIDKYEVMAQNFIWNNPLSKYFPKDLLNENATVKDCDINMFMLGFGAVNQVLLKNLLIHSQFVTHDKILKPNPINVYVYDNKKIATSYDLMNGIYKYKKSELNKDKYLDLPRDYISNFKYFAEYNVNAQNFITSIYDKLKENESKNKVNYYFISLGDDYLNSTIAKNLEKYLSNIDNNKNIIFVRTKSGLELPINNINKNSQIIYFGNEKKIFTYNNLIMGGIYKAAGYEGCLYQDEEEIDEKKLSKEWTLLSKTKQAQNVNSILSLSFKFALLGMDVNNFIESEYNEKYLKYQTEYKEFADYLAKEQKEFNARDVMAFIEHERWNAVELAYGTLPMKKELCIKKDENNEKVFFNETDDELYHLCLTSQKGLNDYYDFIIKNTNDCYDGKKFKQGRGKKSPNPDVVKYDYDIMDYAIKHINSIKKQI